MTAVNGGTLTVNSILADNGPALALSLGTPNNNNFSDGIVVLNGTNTYTGGTTINAGGMGLTIVAGGSGNAFGTGAITVASGASFGLQVASPATTIANPINFISGGTLYFTGANDIILGGALSGSGSLNLYNAAPINATLAGDNSALTGDLLIGNGTLNLKNNNAAGQGTVYFQSSAATVAFGGAATAPVLHGIDGSAGSLVLPNSSTLTFQVDDDNQGSEFGGTISAAAGTTNATNASVVVTAGNNNTNGTLYLYGHNYYTGGTTISGYGALGLGASDSAGSGPVTINATNGQGGLILNTGVSFTNALVLTSGGLAGLGAFNPVSVNGDSTPGRTITFGTNQLVYPGIPGDGINLPGVLTIQTNVAFANNGSFREMIQNPGLTGTITGNPTTNINAGFGQLFLQGNLDLTSLATGGFFISLESIDPTGHKGFSSSVTWGQSYSLLLVQTTGTISGFSAANFTVDCLELPGRPDSRLGFQRLQSRLAASLSELHGDPRAVHVGLARHRRRVPRLGRVAQIAPFRLSGVWPFARRSPPVRIAVFFCPRVAMVAPDVRRHPAPFARRRSRLRSGVRPGSACGPARAARPAAGKTHPRLLGSHRNQAYRGHLGRAPLRGAVQSAVDQLPDLPARVAGHRRLLWAEVTGVFDWGFLIFDFDCPASPLRRQS